MLHVASHFYVYSTQATANMSSTATITIQTTVFPPTHAWYVALGGAVEQEGAVWG